VLGVGELHQPTFPQGIEADDLRATPPRRLQFREHPWVVRSGILTDHEDRVGQSKVPQGDGALADPDRLGQAHTRRFVAHVRTVGEIIGSKSAGEELVEEGCLVTRATGRVEHRFVGILDRIENASDLRKGVLPRHRHVVVALPVVPHRMRETPLPLEPVVALLPEIGDRVSPEEVRVRPLSRRLERYGFRTILAELESRGAIGLGPRASGTVESIGLVHPEHRARSRPGCAVAQHALSSRDQGSEASRR
jgi:hypothetical protein